MAVGAQLDGTNADSAPAGPELGRFVVGRVERSARRSDRTTATRGRQPGGSGVLPTLALFILCACPPVQAEWENSRADTAPNGEAFGAVVGGEGKVQHGGQTGQQQPEDGNRKPDRKIDSRQAANIRCSSTQTED